MSPNNSEHSEAPERVIVVGDHPWAGHSGEVLRTEDFGTAGCGIVVRLDNGIECAVFRSETRETSK